MTIFYYIASIITFALAVYAVYLLLKVRSQKQKLEELKNSIELQERDKIASVVSSIVDISKAMQQEQCPTIEGCIRLKVLIDQLRLDEASRKPFEIFYTVYDKTEHIPTHQAWADLEKREKMSFTRDMMLIEGEHQDEIKAAVDITVEHFKGASENSKFDLGKAI
ncbi:DUF2489 domain-containing protein [Kangiella sediminilitoris]|uniref:DUF2489 domain-containing protein n=1 Tax=Kangiella sediminilitoris TaxID=1144748 RepID=A0A1B3BB15_9GAMM|nr:DUF2489 domain-containing protein [Kangiella sediminilitoris]AOE49956.1 hypothetical protein KS2013_1238 [Kangiella sediminilitoris]